MKLKLTPQLYSFLSTRLPDDADEDLQSARAFAATSTVQAVQVAAQARALLADLDFPVDEMGSEANRWFGDADEAKAWLSGIVGALESATNGVDSAGGGVVTQDSNGTVLLEGDTVQVIKDLKVKGGSSDLKRGTLIKKIHLIDDPNNIECRVDGSTLVLKTQFLKKS